MEQVWQIGRGAIKAKNPERLSAQDFFAYIKYISC